MVTPRARGTAMEVQHRAIALQIISLMLLAANVWHHW